MVDPIFTYVGGIAFLVLIIGTMLYLTFSTMHIEEGDEHPGESVVKGVGQDNPDEDVEDEFEPAEPISEDEPELVDEDPANVEETEEEVSADGDAPEDAPAEADADADADAEDDDAAADDDAEDEDESA